MTYSRFEELPVWQEAIRLVDKVYDMTESREWKGSRSLRADRKGCVVCLK